MQSYSIRRMVITAALLALTVVFQYIRLLPIPLDVSVYIIGTLVNLCLILAAVLAGLWSGLMISIAAPLVALLQGYAPAPMVPFLIAGNVVLVLLYALIPGPGFRKTGKLAVIPWLLAGMPGAVLKYFIITAGQALMLSSAQGKAFYALLATGALRQVQQLITALVAAVLAYMILPRLKKASNL